jgi:hypothetical protein
MGVRGRSTFVHEYVYWQKKSADAHATHWHVYLYQELYLEAFAKLHILFIVSGLDFFMHMKTIWTKLIGF